MTINQTRHDRQHPRHQLALAKGAIGKSRVVGGIDQPGVRPRLGDLGKHRQTAEPGIEHKNARAAGRIKLVHRRQEIATT